MTFSLEMVNLKKELEKMGNDVIVPDFSEQYSALNREDIERESLYNKIEHDLIRSYFNKIEKGDAVLVCNYSKNDIPNYIGGNSFLEIGFAHVLDKKIFLLNPIPQMGYTDEIEAMNPIIINGDLSLIK